ncbi:intestinal mucin-like protein [Chanos chanos]|uniref:Intestinal mucin-like protein n=1 Tax=Chanos chanos TaxID=29144 RepID=A0A6J2WRI2_CHACN|nr:intestinal mucin-like protein [Chanos chanos]
MREDAIPLQNETFWLCNCTLARCIENNVVEIISYECPSLEPIKCANGKQPVLLTDEMSCCPYYACDCDCEGWGSSHYITNDGLTYSFQGNCTYVLMEEITPQYNLKIYADNSNCDGTQSSSCARSIIVDYNSQAFALKSIQGGAELQCFLGGTPQTLPFDNNGVTVLNTGVYLVLEIAKIGVAVTYGATEFQIDLPYQYFGNNTQGQCGTCNNNQADDCMLPDGRLVESCSVMADYWQATNVYNPDCPVPLSLPFNLPKPVLIEQPCTTNSVCHLLRSSVFEECHQYVSPHRYYEGCLFDSCHMTNPAAECTSLQTYAMACAQFGVCIHWRNHTTICTSDCPVDKVYSPCGPVEPPTCMDSPHHIPVDKVIEGCFCPEGKKLFSKESGLCVDKCGCLDPAGVPREFGERFTHNCQECICMESTKTVMCKAKECSTAVPPICNSPGFVTINETNPEDPCCTTLSCRCDSSSCPVVDSSCQAGYQPVLTVPEGECCPQFTCEPKKVCVHEGVEYQPGQTVPLSECQECSCSWNVDPETQHYQIECNSVTCDVQCEPGFEYVRSDSDKCCGKCVQTHCIMNKNGTKMFLQHGAVWSPPGDTCERYTCTHIAGSFITTNYQIRCPPFDQSRCQPGTVQLAADGCCKVCVEKETGCKVEAVVDYIIHNKCQSEEKIALTYCQGDCNSYSKYSELGDSSCSCCQESHSTNRTVNLRCLNGDVVPYTYTHVEECSCSVTSCHKATSLSSRRRRSLRLAGV